MVRELQLALLISGSGTTMEQIILATRDGRLNGVTPTLLIASNNDAGGIEKAKRLEIPEEDIVVIDPKAFASPEAFGVELIRTCQKRRVNFIGQYGWMPKTPKNFIEMFEGSVVNQHPGPLDPGRPDFGGKGMFGRRVHCARLYYVRAMRMISPWTEVCCQLVDPEYDKGRVLVTKRVPILDDDDVATLQQRALPIEHLVQIAALTVFAEERVFSQQMTTPSFAPINEYVLQDAKRVAALLYPKG